MKKTILILTSALMLTVNSFSQVLYTPGQTVGNNTTNQNVGIGTATPSGILGISQTATATGILKGIVYTGAVNTNQTLSTEIPSLTITTAGRQWATGTLTTQREVLITQPTYSFVGSSTITDAATVGIAGAPVKSTNASITNTHALLIQAGAVSSATNSYGLTVNAQTGATNNYAAAFLGGKVGIGTNAPGALLHLYGAAANEVIIGLVSSMSFLTDNSTGGYGDQLPSGNWIFGSAGKNTTIATTGAGAPGSNGKISLIYRRSASTAYYYSALEFSDVNSGYSNLLLMKSGGNVGIGTASPTSIFHTIASGVKTTSYTGNLLTNVATSSTASLIKAGVEITSTGSWSSGTSAKNIGLYVSAVNGAPTGQNYDAIFNGGGNVGIGTANPVAKLEIKASGTDPAIIVRNQNDSIHFRVRANGYVEARDVLVKTGEIFPDYVFEKNYNLKPLTEVEKYINDNKHLPGVPSASDISKNGLNLVEMDATLLKKVEEQTLYIIDLQKQIIEMQKQIDLIKGK